MKSIGNQIKVINRLQDVFNTLGASAGEPDCICLPQIVVVGAQSTGKSSVLESIVGWDFLPRGSGIVTRCPLVLQLSNVPDLCNSCNNEDVKHDSIDEDPLYHPKFTARFLHKEDTLFTDPDELREEIKRQTIVLAGDGKNVVRERIRLKISSPSMINLTLVDLPGLMKNPIGDQPLDIEHQTKDLIMSFINNQDSLILAVTPMNADMVNSDSIKLAREVDPNGERTLVVLTQLDIMNAGTHARKELTGQVLPFKLGIIGVMNRTQADIERNKTIVEHLADEEKFFESRKEYKDLAKKNGTRYLAKRLNKLLMEHIHERMPSLKKRVEDAQNKYQAELNVLGIQVTEELARSTVSQILKKFADDYCTSLLGSTAGSADKKLGGGARIGEIFHDDFSKALNAVPPLGGLVVSDVIKAIRETRGLDPKLFVPEDAFSQLTRQHIKNLRDPSVRCLNNVFEEMKRIVEFSSEPVQRLLDRFPFLRNSIYSVVTVLATERFKVAEDLVTTLVEIESSYINTKHPDFTEDATELINARKSKNSVNSVNSSANQLQKTGNSQQTEKECHIWQILITNQRKRPGYSSIYDITYDEFGYGIINISEIEHQECELICQLVFNYFNIVRQTIQDTIPKAIVCRLVKFVQNHVHDVLVEKLFDPALFGQFLEESEETDIRRAATNAKLKEVNEALAIITDVCNVKF